MNVTVWKEDAYLLGSEIMPHDYFGGSIALWKNTAIVGAYLDENLGTNSGTAYVFVYHEGMWKEQEKLSPEGAMAADYFGQSVGIYDDTAIIGAYGQADSGYYRGAAYIFARSHRRWSQVAMIRPNDVEDNHMFGFAVEIFNNTVAVGAYGDTSEGANTGAVYMFEYVVSGANDTEIGSWVQTQKLIARDAKQHSNFGIALDLTESMTYYDETYYTLVVGASLAKGVASSSGAAYVFTSAVGGSTWSVQAKLFAYDAVGDERFGAAVAVDGDSILVGAPDDCAVGTDSGAAYLYKQSSSSTSNRGRWQFSRKLIGNDTVAYDNFGTSVDIWGSTLVVGSEQANGIELSTGALYVITAYDVEQKVSKKSSILATEKDQFVFILNMLPILLVMLPVCVFSSVIYFHRHYKSIAHVISRRITRSELPLQEYASMHGSVHSSRTSQHGDDSSVDNSVDVSQHTYKPGWRNNSGDLVGGYQEDPLEVAIKNASQDTTPMLMHHLRHSGRISGGTYMK
eukprot:CAMPEP_0185029876 /NCGR_PEP_ID=MMETSP1103-20130426/16477_1 /TAXON_ID=36769 /ORGANISM="Paraphysomonas bandaiensis, Strain Caron Lab Isolate" /LENGTH=511 /DNA_ID=CAMNT_0027564789 /DNA_START=232 /DNA_END=1767 /DNA_ORIENTATION=+